MKIDTTEFDRTMLEYIKHSKKSIPEALNQKAYWVAKGAIKATRVANKDKITGFETFPIEAKFGHYLKRHLLPFS